MGDGPDAERAALERLEHPEAYPGLVERKRARVRLRVWRHPCFEPHRSWAVLETTNHSLETEAFLRRVSWDHRHPGFVQPVTYGCEAPLEGRVHAALLSELRAIALPPFPPPAPLAGRDGASCGVEAGDAWGASARLAWWEDPPPGWEPLAAWHARTVALFDSLLPAATATGR